MGAQRRALRFARPWRDRRPADRRRLPALLAAWLLAAGVCAAGCAAGTGAPEDVPRWRAQPPRLIAHGGGAWGELHVTNSLQALDHAAAEEFLLIEVDLSWTTDGHLVLLHDWDGAFRALFGAAPGPRSLEGFLGLTAVDGLQQMGLEALDVWMAAHPEVGVVTDIKTERLRGLEVLADRLAAVREQVVPQVHDEVELRRARELGFEAVILTLYASPLTDDEVLELAAREPLYAVTVPKERALAGLARRLDEAGVTCFAHTVNNQLMATRLVHAGAHGVYTDRLTPARGRRDARELPDSWQVSSQPGGAAPGGRGLLIVDLWDSLDGRCGTLAVRWAGPGDAPETVSLQASTGDDGPPRLLEVVPGPEPVRLDTLFPGALPRWIGAPPGVALELRWDLLDRTPLVRRSARELMSSWSARGPADDLGGLALFLLNPGPESRSVDISVHSSAGGRRAVERSIEAGSVRVERLPLDGATGRLELGVEGGPVLVHLLRAGPECSVLR